MVMNLVTILIAAVASMLVGMIWYSPSVFGKQWMKLSNIKSKKKKGMTKNYIISFISSLITSFVLNIFVIISGASTTNEGLILGLLSSLGFIATTSLSMVLWEGKSAKLYIIKTLYYVVSFMLMGAILVVGR